MIPPIQAGGPKYNKPNSKLSEMPIKSSLTTLATSYRQGFTRGTRTRQTVSRQRQIWKTRRIFRTFKKSSTGPWSIGPSRRPSSSINLVEYSPLAGVLTDASGASTKHVKCLSTFRSFGGAVCPVDAVSA